MVHILLDFKEAYDEVGGYSERNQAELWHAFSNHLERAIAIPIFGSYGNPLTHPRYSSPKLITLYESQIRKIYSIIPANATPKFIAVKPEWLGENSFFLLEVFLRCRNSSSHLNTTTI